MSKDKTAVNFPDLFAALRDLDRDRQARQAVIMEKWQKWIETNRQAGLSIETTAPAEVEQAARHNEATYAQGARALHRRHEGEIRAERAARAEALREPYRILVEAMEAFAQFEVDLRKFAIACGAEPAPSLVDANVTGLNFSNWSTRVDRAIRPAPSPRPPTIDVVAARLAGILAELPS
jgi:hypothetical protein